MQMKTTANLTALFNLFWLKTKIKWDFTYLAVYS
ncbi:unknown [[Mannheimia] succiniciproducens MBEL55E]|uniref:Uncharacterized protein n=1 Tax=Mannheimia succiniciproducens (strain KCTC 0769BP / MBEL55E) TaxID=221988 RepID=Q65SM8_MANSM|nr:unknown [[Mannheimia] succiniciproducens MBEL55E]